jgi:riboflavin synthase
MFTGIVGAVGEVVEIAQRGDMRARIAGGYDHASLSLGASVSCDGVCLTVVDLGADGDVGWFAADISAETLSKTTLGDWTVGRRVNLERALRVGDELGGHIVTGHVDGVGRVVETRPEGDSLRVDFEAPEALAPFIAPKGSAAIDGASLTVNGVEGRRFGVNLIPHTLAATTFGRLAEGVSVNIEIDVLARYVARLREATA